MDGLVDELVDERGELLSQHTRELLRQAVIEHARTELRRRYPPALHIGVPGQRVAAVELAGEDRADAGLRTDVVAALRVRAGASADQLAWLTRRGALDLQDVDAGWLAAVRAAYAEAGAPAPFFAVVNRRGWRDPCTGLGRTWARVRPRRP